MTSGASHIFWLGGYGAEIPPIDDFGSAVVFEAAFDGKQGIGIGFQQAASRLAKKWDSSTDVDRMRHASVFSPALGRRGRRALSDARRRSLRPADRPRQGFNKGCA